MGALRDFVGIAAGAGAVYLGAENMAGQIAATDELRQRNSNAVEQIAHFVGDLPHALTNEFNLSNDGRENRKEQPYEQTLSTSLANLFLVAGGISVAAYSAYPYLPRRKSK